MKNLLISLGVISLVLLLAMVVSSFVEESSASSTPTIIHDTTYVEVPVPVDTCVGAIDFYVGEAIATPYQPSIAQCDSTPFNTGDGSFIDTNLLKTHSIRWCALSQDLLWFNGGPFHYGDTVWVYCQHESMRGWWIAHDAMNKRHKNRIDFLQWYDTDMHTTKGVVISNKPFDALVYKE